MDKWIYSLTKDAFWTNCKKIYNSREECIFAAISKCLKENINSFYIGKISLNNPSVVTDKEEIMYCAYCKKELTEQDEKMKILCPRDGEELWFYFHKDCDYIPIDDLVTALAGDSI